MPRANRNGFLSDCPLGNGVHMGGHDCRNNAGVPYQATQHLPWTTLHMGAICNRNICLRFPNIAPFHWNSATVLVGRHGTYFRSCGSNQSIIILRTANSATSRKREPESSSQCSSY